MFFDFNEFKHGDGGGRATIAFTIIFAEIILTKPPIAAIFRSN